MAGKQWVKMPTNWIRFTPTLKLLSRKDLGASISALILYITFCLFKNDDPTDEFEIPGFVQVTYSDLEHLTGLSRPLISRGLKLLLDHQLIYYYKKGNKNVYQLTDFDPERFWGKLPREPFLKNGKKGGLKPFHLFRIKRDVELNALKIYFAIISYVDNKKNYAQISYKKLEEVTGVGRNSIRSALSFLVGLTLIQIDHAHLIIDRGKNRAEIESDSINYVMPSIYRVTGITPRHHLGTQKRGSGTLDPPKRQEGNPLDDLF